MNKRVQAFR